MGSFARRNAALLIFSIFPFTHYSIFSVVFRRHINPSGKCAALHKTNPRFLRYDHLERHLTCIALFQSLVEIQFVYFWHRISPFHCKIKIVKTILLFTEQLTLSCFNTLGHSSTREQRSIVLSSTASPVLTYFLSSIKESAVKYAIYVILKRTCF